MTWKEEAREPSETLACILRRGLEGAGSGVRCLPLPYEGGCPPWGRLSWEDREDQRRQQRVVGESVRKGPSLPVGISAPGLLSSLAVSDEGSGVAEGVAPSVLHSLNAEAVNRLGHVTNAVLAALKALPLGNVAVEGNQLIIDVTRPEHENPAIVGAIVGVGSHVQTVAASGSALEEPHPTLARKVQ